MSCLINLEVEMVDLKSKAYDALGDTTKVIDWERLDDVISSLEFSDEEEFDVENIRFGTSWPISGSDDARFITLSENICGIIVSYKWTPKS